MCLGLRVWMAVWMGVWLPHNRRYNQAPPPPSSGADFLVPGVIYCVLAIPLPPHGPHSRVREPDA